MALTKSIFTDSLNFSIMMAELNLNKISAQAEGAIPLAAQSKSVIDEFLKWFSQQSEEHQVELAEFIGFFCYRKLFQSFISNEAKIFAFREYLHSFQNNYEGSIKFLKFID